MPIYAVYLPRTSDGKDEVIHISATRFEIKTDTLVFFDSSNHTTDAFGFGKFKYVLQRSGEPKKAYHLLEQPKVPAETWAALKGLSVASRKGTKRTARRKKSLTD